MSKANNKLAQLRELRKNSGNGVQYLINEAYRILGNPIILYDVEWNILACAEDAVTDDPIWNNHINDGTVDKNIDVFIDEGFLSIMTRPDKVILLSSERLKYNRFFGKVYNKDDLPIAGVSVVASDKPFEDDDLMVIDAICKILSGEICKIPYYRDYAQKLIDTYLSKLINRDIGNAKDKMYISGYIEMIYKGLKDNLYVAVADISRCDPTYSKLDYYRDLFKRTRPAFKYSVYSNYVVIIISTDAPILYPDLKRNFNRLNKLFEQDNIKVGISSRFENLFELSKHYNNAVEALNNGLKHDGGQWIFVYDNED